MNLRHNKITSQERREVLIGLNATSPQSQGPCLTDEELACFTDHRMNHAEHEAAAAHLDGCRECYAKWMDMADVLAGGRNERIQRWKRPAWASLYAAAACLVLLYFFRFIIPSQTGVDTLLADAFASVQEHPITLKSSALNLPWQQPRRTYGFMADKPDTAVNRAFGAGLFDAQQALNQKPDKIPMPRYLAPVDDDINAGHWSETNYSGYYHLGRLGFLVQAVCKADQPPEYALIQKLTAVLAHIRLDYLSETDKITAPSPPINALLDDLQAALQAIDATYTGRQKYREVAEAADALIHTLSPRQMPGM